jgi:hypothetical protein
MNQNDQTQYSLSLLLMVKNLSQLPTKQSFMPFSLLCLSVNRKIFEYFHSFILIFIRFAFINSLFKVFFTVYYLI